MSPCEKTGRASVFSKHTVLPNTTNKNNINRASCELTFSAKLKYKKINMPFKN